MTAGERSGVEELLAYYIADVGRGGMGGGGTEGSNRVRGEVPDG